MNLLQGVQALFREAKLPGTAPAAVAGLTGRNADLLAWYIEAWNDIQRERDGKWLWARNFWTLDTTINQSLYGAGNCTDTATAAPISSFRSWYFDRNEPPLIYLIADGEATERELTIWDWPSFRRRYEVGTHTASYPGYISSQHPQTFNLGPTPDAVYRISGRYWRGNQTLAADGDLPLMPADYHMAIVYRAIIKYGFNAVAREVLARANAELPPIYNALVENQAWSRFSMTMAGPLA